MKKIDALGLSCPEPVILLKNALKEKEDFTILLDSYASIANCKGLLERKKINFEELIENDVTSLIVKGE